MADADEAQRKDVQTKASEELQSIEFHHFALAFGAVVFVAEGDLLRADVDESVIGDRVFVRVATEVFDDGFRAAEGRLSVNDLR